MRRLRDRLRYLRTVALYFGHSPKVLTMDDAESIAEMATWTGIRRGFVQGIGEVKMMDNVLPSFEQWTGEVSAVPTASPDPDNPWG